jgi:hypothetical protein
MEQKNELEEICKRIDELFSTYFQAYEDYEQQQDILGQYMRSVSVYSIWANPRKGFFNIAKARYGTGGTKITPMQYDLNARATTVLQTRLAYKHYLFSHGISVIDNETKFCVEEKSEDFNDDDSNEPPENELIRRTVKSPKVFTQLTCLNIYSKNLTRKWKMKKKRNPRLIQYEEEAKRTIHCCGLVLFLLLISVNHKKNLNKVLHFYSI